MAYTDVDKSTEHFNTKTYTGNNGNTQSLTGVGFQPDWVWVKIRNDTRKHNIYDAIRGVTKRLVPNSDVAQDTVNGVTAFNSDGFSVGNETDCNQGSNTFVGWCWKGGNGTASNSNGSITSTVSANTTAGFSIVQWSGNESSGATVGHGLGAVPELIIKKRQDSGSGTYYNYWKVLGNDKSLYWPYNSAVGASGSWANTTPTSTVFSNGSSNVENGGTMIAYCFAPKQGFSKFGSYTGNNNANGPFVYTGFKPAFILIKDSSATNDWHIRDNKRSPINPSINFLVPNNTNAEVTAGEKIDLLSNGFKIKQTGGKVNDSGNTYIYMAFAENPFVSSSGVAGLAR